MSLITLEIRNRALHQQRFEKLNLPPEVKEALKNSFVIVPTSPDQLAELSLGLPAEYADLIPAGDEELYLAPGSGERFEIKYRVGSEIFTEKVVTLHPNGILGNPTEAKMRRRQAGAMQIMDMMETDKSRMQKKYKHHPEKIKKEAYEWLSQQILVVFPFQIGPRVIDQAGVCIAPLNAAYAAFGGARLQEMLDVDTFGDFESSMFIYLVPPFRHTKFGGDQVVGHDRNAPYSMFAFNLYPGPGFKKGIFGYLLHYAEKHGFEILHAAATRVKDHSSGSETVFVHQGPSGGGKSESTMKPITGPDDRLVYGRSMFSDDEYSLIFPSVMEFKPIGDDMLVAHPSFQNGDGGYYVADGEYGWFIRTDSILGYGDDPLTERICLRERKENGPLFFLNYDAHPGFEVLPWKPFKEESGPCSNPRVVIPRSEIPGIVNGQQKVRILSWGLRQPPCSRDKPSFGVFGLGHLMLPAQMILHQLVALRGYANPSIEKEGSSEAAALVPELASSSYPFSPGTLVEAANMTGRIVTKARNARLVVLPNQHSGSYETDFGGLWVMRHWLCQKANGALNLEEHIRPARHPLLGYTFRNVRIRDHQVPEHLLRINRQSDVGDDGYDNGAAILSNAYKDILKDYLKPGLDKHIRHVIEACLGDASHEEYKNLFDWSFEPWTK
ncbi:MAG: DUF4914 family protein [bacterium]|nr:DUF4914 family protein [bacterium]